MTRRRRPRTAQERVIGVLGTVAPGSLGGRIRNTRPAIVLQPNTGGPPDTGGAFDPNLEPVVIGENAAAGSGTPDDPTAGQADAKYAVAIGSNATTSGGWYGVAVGDSTLAGDASAVAIGDSAHAVANSDVAVGHDATTSGGGDSVAVGFASGAGRQAVAVGDTSRATARYAVAVGSGASAAHIHATAIGPDSATTKTNQIMLGTNAGFVEIPGSSSTAPNGLVLTDTATGTRYIVQITSGALVLSAAP